MPFQSAYLPPIVVQNQALGLCFAGRPKGDGFNEREGGWIDQIVDRIAGEFATIRGGGKRGPGFGSLVKN
ncbi:hypothetical protein [Desulfosarcina sp.]|uniref:hypothetical protein n=1 Tax=Desulfosarcina sp. TaxID=2027861 RepID=UPI0035694A23